MTRLGLSEARNILPEAANRVAYGSERVVLQRRGKDVAVLVSMEDLALLEAMEDRLDIEAIGRARAAQGDAAPEPWSTAKAELGLR